jgi:hypothetical protein
MNRNRFALAFGLVFLCALPGAVRAQMPSADVNATDVGAAAAGAAYQASRYEAALVLQVLPLDAQVLLDGKPIGTARELVAIAVPVTPGWHTVEVGAAGFYPYTGRFVADQHSSANGFVVTLVPVR